MAVAVVMDFEGGTLEQYDAVVARMGFTEQGPGAPGGLFPWATKTANGIRVTDVWEDHQQFEAFAADKIGPITEEVGVPGPPVVTVHEVHNHLTSGAAVPA